MVKHEAHPHSPIELFEAFLLALSQVVERDAQLFSWKKHRLAITHRLALYLDAHLNVQQNKLFVDLAVPFEEDAKVLTPDILVHNRSQGESLSRVLAIVCREHYLQESELLGFHALNTEGGTTLTLAIAFLPQKDYILIYRADDIRIDYYHFYRKEKHCRLLKQREIADIHSSQQQLRLIIKRGKQSSPLR